MLKIVRAGRLGHALPCPAPPLLSLRCASQTCPTPPIAHKPLTYLYIQISLFLLQPLNAFACDETKKREKKNLYFHLQLFLSFERLG